MLWQKICARYQGGFTLLELLIVIAIIGILSAIVIAALNDSREKGRVAKTVSEVRELEKAIHLYYSDTGQFPSSCTVSAAPYSIPVCVDSNDPFQNSLGVSGWNGPYIKAAILETGWGGHIGFLSEIIGPLDLDGDGNQDYVIELDEDAPETGPNDNSAVIPLSAQIRIDQILDDGNLETGRLRRRDYSPGPGPDPWGTNSFPALGPFGELIYWFQL